VIKEQYFGLGTGPQLFSHLLPCPIPCSMSGQKFAVRVCQVSTVAMVTTQLVLNQFKNYLSHQLRIQ